MGLNLFIDVPLFENIPASAIPALLYICCINSAAGLRLPHDGDGENVRAGGVTHFLPKAHLGADLRTSFPQGGNSAQYDRRHRLLPDWIAVRDPPGILAQRRALKAQK